MTTPDVSLTFGPYAVRPSKRQLLKDGVVLPVGSRAFDILLALMERPGHPLSAVELISQVWQQRIVHPGALRVHIAALRKVLEDDRAHCVYIVTTPSSGYRFGAPVRRNLPSQAAAEDCRHADPARRDAGSAIARSRLRGRSAVVAELSARVQTHRCITITGPGGVGKSAVVHAVVQRCREHGQEVHAIDLAAGRHPVDVPRAVAAALGLGPELDVDGPDGLPRLVEHLRHGELVLVLDNCEHVIGAAAHAVEAILLGAARVAVVATSREPLRIPGEWVHRLAGLPAPPAAHSPADASGMQFDAVHLFIEHALENDAGFAPDAGELASICDICRRLGGNPLAILLAAGHLRDAPVSTIESHLGDLDTVACESLEQRRPGRHRTLRESMDRDLELLSAPERRLLGCLSGIDGPFDLELARQACHHVFAADAGVAALTVDAHLYALASKSLILAERVGDSSRYRLDEPLRRHASLRLSTSPTRPRPGVEPA